MKDGCLAIASNQQHVVGIFPALVLRPIHSRRTDLHGWHCQTNSVLALAQQTLNDAGRQVPSLVRISRRRFIVISTLLSYSDNTYLAHRLLLMPFLALFVTLSTKQSAGRMRIWRALRTLGAATLRDGVYVLPESPSHAAALEQLAADARSVEGTADIYLLDSRGEAQKQALIALFDRGADYAELLKTIRATDPANAKALRALRREFLALAAIDFFPGEARRQTEDALTALEAAASGEPTDSRGQIRRLASTDFSSRTWATRKHLWVDRMASAWLIRRFIDKKATFLWLDSPKKCPKTALGFDFDGAAFTHVGGHVTFEVLMLSFGLEADPALARIAAIVHFLDAGGVPVPEASGIEAVLAGARDTAADDDALLTEASRLFDNLHHHYSQDAPHD